MCFTKDNDLFAVNRETKTVHHYKLSQDYSTRRELAIFGREKLKNPMEVNQLPDGRVVVCDGGAGHSVKV